MKTYFVIEHSHITTIEEATVAEAVGFQNWLDIGREGSAGSLEGCKTFFLSNPEPENLNELIRENGIENVVPIGSVEFVSRFCQEHGVPVPTALNIPPELDDYRYLQRKIWRGLSKKDLLDLPNIETQCQGPDRPDRYLIKPGKTIKRFEMTAFRPEKDNLESLHVPDNEPLFVSEYLVPSMLAEWRLFIQHGLIQDIRQYYLKQWVMPDLTLCKEMTEKLKGYPAITLDVAVLETGQTVVVEAHTFLACGFYGMEGTQVLTMSHLAWKAQCDQKKKTIRKEDNRGN